MHQPVETYDRVVEEVKAYILERPLRPFGKPRPEYVQKARNLWLHKNAKWKHGPPTTMGGNDRGGWIGLLNGIRHVNEAPPMGRNSLKAIGVKMQ
jgi:hypothetical protein